MTPSKLSHATGRIPSLDGLRAVSICLVIVYHTCGAQFDRYLSSVGNLGVRVFFVISGFLITGLLLKELDATASISLKNFYIRRMLRIFPAFYVFCIAVAIGSAIGFIALRPGDLIEAATYTINFFPGTQQSVYVRHIWSLCVEEQFYLIWPVTLCIAGKRRGMMIAAGGIVVAPLIRLAYWFFVPAFHQLLDRRFETVADALATGCLLAGIQFWLATVPRYNAFLRSRYFLLVPVAVYAIANFLGDRPRFFLGVGETLLNVGIALCIDRWTRYPDGVVGGLLNTRFIAGIGVVSYSIYLWQQPFVSPESKWDIGFPFNVVLTLALSVGSYFLIEGPFRRLKSRIRSRSPRSMVASSQ